MITVIFISQEAKHSPNSYVPRIAMSRCVHSSCVHKAALHNAAAASCVLLCAHFMMLLNQSRQWD